MKKTTVLFATALFLFSAIAVFAREARLVRYPHYHNGRIVFTYLGDIWTADENGQNVQRLTVNRARDVYGRFRLTESGSHSRATATETSTCF